MKINLASGQRPFPKPWVNIDAVDQGYDIDIVSDIRSLPKEIDSCEVMVAHHVAEHIDMSHVPGLFKHWHDRLVQGGRLLVAVPDMRAITDAWIAGRIDNFIFNVNVYGAYQGRETDLHRWSYTEQSLNSVANEQCSWHSRRITDLRQLDSSVYAGADLAMDWWVLMMEFQK